MSRAYYNEFDPKAAAWLRELIGGGHIAPGDVDTRSILEVKPDDLKPYAQCHFFAGIGGWSHALRLAGVPDNLPIWTGSCPCQPLSSAGLRKGHADERHLWPAFHDLVAERRPSTIFGEQVASADGREWFAGIRADLEGIGYACGGADMCSAGVGAPHIRQRLYWVAHAGSKRWGEGEGFYFKGPRTGGRQFESSEHSRACGMAYPDSDRAEGNAGGEESQRGALGPESCGGGKLRDSGVADADCKRGCSRTAGSSHASHAWFAGEARRFWDAYEFVPCRDGKARRVEPGSFPLAYGVSGRVGLLRGYGNAINPELAARFVVASL